MSNSDWQNLIAGLGPRVNSKIKEAEMLYEVEMRWVRDEWHWRGFWRGLLSGVTLVIAALLAVLMFGGCAAEPERAALVDYADALCTWRSSCGEVEDFGVCRDGVVKLRCEHSADGCGDDAWLEQCAAALVQITGDDDADVCVAVPAVCFY